MNSRMSKTTTTVGFKLANEEVARLDQIAKQYGVSRSYIARMAYETGLTRATWMMENVDLTKLDKRSRREA